jgi:hypothetical protein
MDKVELLKLSKEELVRLLELAVEGQKLATKNMSSINEMSKQLYEENRQLKDEKATLEAELIVLKNKPAKD